MLVAALAAVWSLRLGTWLGVGNDPRYTPSTTFETFPFPQGLTPDIPATDYAADPRAHDAAGLAADQPAQKRAAQRTADAADGRARNLLFAGIGIGDAGRQADQRDRTQARHRDSTKLHFLSPLVRHPAWQISAVTRQ